MNRFLPKILIILGVILFLVLTFRPHFVVSKNTYFGSFNLGKLTEQDAKNKISEILQKPIYLNANYSSRAIQLSEIGVGFDRSKLEASTTLKCLLRVGKLSIFCLETKPSKTQNDVLVINEKVLRDYLTQLEAEFAFVAKNTQILFENYSFSTPGENAQISIDYEDFKKELSSKISDTSKISLKINLKSEDDVYLQKQSSLALIEKLTTPLLIKYGRQPIYIPKETLKTFIDSEETLSKYTNFIKEEPIRAYLKELAEKYATDDVRVVEYDAVKSIQNALLLKAANYEINNAVILPLEGKPRTNGELHDVYLEVIKSQQRLYRFEKGKLTKTYIVSTGLTWETPAGEFEVLGKQKMTISYFGNWYMPDYLPIGLVNGYRFGFHSIPYHMDGYGNIYSRDPNTMGSPATGGCIQLKPEEAEELFEWAEIGTPVYVYE
ncbi:hypothetical protein A2415_02100 [candidate division WWE3 bacterium RIFOXYC1_FULL_39_7]|uniref:L,D-TPase catalytic domain-containing protein n=2 Tax=Katanobacteria TaxID=422282 RepID=A0A1F4X8U3_UNCKA|nr:MAG: hypothetical protein A2415_02100 [candidate division WWE3 bacterium RIFOXYC1_FULL_39_7]OGC78107.1 MAG: hypothetical protein A2619_05130 [candidate division WWE3 bacterium RIFOXYD1_FULL_39_9]